MPFLIAEADKLIFDGGTVPRRRGMDPAAEHRRAVEIGEDRRMRFGVRVGEVAAFLLALEPVGHE